MGQLRCAVVAWEVEHSTVDDNLSKAEAYIADAKRNDADAIGFVEYFSLLGTGLQQSQTAEQPGKGKVTAWAVDMAARHGIEIWCPFIELGPRGEKYNSVAVVDPLDGIVGTHHEFHYFALEGNGLNVGHDVRVTKRPWGTFGCLICFDIHYPEVSRVLAVQGTDLVFWPTLTAGPWSVEAVRKKASVRCMDNGFWMIESNTAAAPPYAPYAGKSSPGSCVYDPEGNIVAGTGYRPGIVFVEIDLDRGSYGTGIFGSDPREDLRTRFQDWLRPEFYAKAYDEMASPTGGAPD